MNNYERKMKTIMEMYRFCKENKITNFSILVDYARESNEKWFKTICKNEEEVVEMLEDVKISLNNPHRAL